MLRTTGPILVLALFTQAPVAPPQPTKTDPDAEVFQQQLKELEEFAKELQKTDPEVAARKWTYDRLIQAADAVVIADFVQKREVPFNEKDAETLHGAGSVVGIESRFDVRAVLRPDPKWKETPESVHVFHFNWKGKVLNLWHLSLVDFSRKIFRPSTICVEMKEGDYYYDDGRPPALDERRQYLLFLTARPDGRYEPVTGQYFSYFSFRRIDSVGELTR